MTTAHKLTLLGAIGLFLNLFASVALMGGTITVENTNNGGAGSLRQAIIDASADPTINTVSLEGIQPLPGSPQPVIELLSSLSVGPEALNIIADKDRPKPILRAKDNNHRLISMDQSSEGEFMFSHIQFENGYGFPSGGAINYLQSTEGKVLSLIIEGCTFYNNRVWDPNEPANHIGFGGAISFRSRTTNDEPSIIRILNSSFENNKAFSTNTDPENFATGYAVYIASSRADFVDNYFVFNDGNGSGRYGGTVALLNGVTGVNDSGSPQEEVRFLNCYFSLNGSNSNRGVSGILVRSTESAATVGDMSILVQNSVFDANGNMSSGPVIQAGNTQTFSGYGKTSFLVENSIFTLNRGGLYSVYRGISNSAARFVHATIANNWHYEEEGTSLYFQNNAELELERTVVASNIPIGVTQNEDFSPDIQFAGSSTFDSKGYNFVGVWLPTAAGDLYLLDQAGTAVSNPLNPMLGPYAQYGDDEIWVMLPLAGGPLTEQIPGPYTSGSLQEDIRGVSRGWDRVDIGAVQLRRLTYSSWATSVGLSGGNNRRTDRDSSGDGLSNGLSYFLGLNPTVFNLNPVSALSESGSLFIEFTRNQRAGLEPSASNGISEWALEYSGDLEEWFPYTSTPEITLIEPGSEDYVRYRYTVDPSEADRRFFRLRVE